jgi:uncharacterized DUF497 family protein
MDLEYDRVKSASNKKKHGIDFIEAQAIWADVDRLEIPGISEDEPRVLIIGKISDRYWTAVITYRNDRIRIISARRSRVGEIKLYES